MAKLSHLELAAWFITPVYANFTVHVFTEALFRKSTAMLSKLKSSSQQQHHAVKVQTLQQIILHIDDSITESKCCSHLTNSLKTEKNNALIQCHISYYKKSFRPAIQDKCRVCLSTLPILMFSFIVLILNSHTKYPVKSWKKLYPKEASGENLLQEHHKNVAVLTGNIYVV